MHHQLSLAGVNSPRTRTKKTSSRQLLHERIAMYGVETITAPEILADLTDIPLEKLQNSIDEHGLIDFARSIDTLDITDTQRKKLSLVFEIARKIGASGLQQKEAFDSSFKAGEHFRMLLSTRTVEEFVVAFLNSQNRATKTVTAFKGTLNETAVFPREIVKMALLHNAVSVVVAHNHPGGGSRPSQADIATTKKLKAALEAVDIKLLDHFIVCGDSYTSFAEVGLL